MTIDVRLGKVMIASEREVLAAVTGESEESDVSSGS